MTPEQEKFIAVLAALYPEGIAVEEYPMIIAAADLAEKHSIMKIDIEIDKEVEREMAEEGRCEPPSLPDAKFIDNKNCAQCMQVLPLDQFYKQAKSPDGLRSICKKCKPHRGGRRPKEKAKQPSSAEINKVRAKARRG